MTRFCRIELRTTDVPAARLFYRALLEPALAAVRASGGLVLEPVTLPNGARVAICDDPQGAAFALQEGSLP